MAAYFFDSSAIVKRYISEKGSASVVDVTDPVANNRIYIARITRHASVAGCRSYIRDDTPKTRW